MFTPFQKGSKWSEPNRGFMSCLHESSELYSKLGLRHGEILSLLSTIGQSNSMRTLRRILKSMQLCHIGRMNPTQVAAFFIDQLKAAWVQVALSQLYQSSTCCHSKYSETPAEDSRPTAVKLSSKLSSSNYHVKMWNFHVIMWYLANFLFFGWQQNASVFKT